MRRFCFRSQSGTLVLGLLLTCLAVVTGCQKPSATPATAKTPVSDSDKTDAGSATDAASEAPSTPKKRTYAPVQLGGSSSASNGGAIAANVDSESVLEHLQPLQVLLGKWSGNARKAAALHELQWIWDFQSKPTQPALVMTSEKSSYIREGRLTYDPAASQFLFAMSTPEGVTRLFKGTFSQPVEDVAGDDKKLQRTFKLEMQEAPAADIGEQWQVALHQLENNRYLVELDRRRGTGPFQRVDTIHSQREGTSFALSDSDYGEKTCIISQGLGTISVSYKGQSFWVCCSGCQAAFNDDPEKWIAKWEVKKKEMAQ